MKEKNKQNDFEVIVPLSKKDVEHVVSKRTKILNDNNVLNRLNNLERDCKSEYNRLAAWVYDAYKFVVPYYEHKLDKIPIISAIEYLPSNKFDKFLNLLEFCEGSAMKKESTASEPEEILSKPGYVFSSDKGFRDMEKEESTVHVPDYISFTIARHALTDIIEELLNSNAKDIIVTKEDGNLVVKYKPSWRK